MDQLLRITPTLAMVIALPLFALGMTTPATLLYLSTFVFLTAGQVWFGLGRRHPFDLILLAASRTGVAVALFDLVAPVSVPHRHAFFAVVLAAFVVGEGRFILGNVSRAREVLAHVPVGSESRRFGEWIYVLPLLLELPAVAACVRAALGA